MNTLMTRARVLWRAPQLQTYRDACLAIGGWAFVAVLGFIAARGPGNWLGGPIQTVIFGLSVVLTAAGFVLWAVMIRRQAVANRNRTRNQTRNLGPVEVDGDGPVATAPAGRNLHGTRTG